MEQNNTSLQVKKARWVGALFLSAFLLYGIGRNLFESELFNQKCIGAALIITNSIVVIFIGFFLRKTIIQYNLWAGNAYLFSRVIESIGLVIIVINLVSSISFSLDFGYFVAMLSLGIGSIPMCYIFFKHNVLPKWLAIWGLIGYTFLALGFLMELFGKEWSMYLLILGGLWELTFSIWLIIKAGTIKTN